MKRFNINSSVRFVPSTTAKQIYGESQKKLMERCQGLYVDCQLKVDGNGFCTMPGWEFMNIFGSSMAMGRPVIPVDNAIFIEDGDLEDAK